MPKDFDAVGERLFLHEQPERTIHFSSKNRTKKVDIIYLAGKDTLSLLPKLTEKVTNILRRARIRFCTLEVENYGGLLLYQLGRFEEAKRVAEHNTSTINDVKKRTGAKVVVVASSYFYNALTKYYPLWGLSTANLNISYMADYVYELIADRQLKFLTGLSRSLTYHEPCNTGSRITGREDTVRALIALIPGASFQEAKWLQEEVKPCGSGLYQLMYPQIADKLAHQRLDEVREYTNAEVIVTSCVFCQAHLAGALGKDVVRNILDIVSDLLG